MSKPANITIPHGLVAADGATLIAKLQAFAQNGAPGFHVVLDFDRTLTIKKPGASDDVTTWYILGQHLPPEGKIEYKNLFQKYRGAELSGELTMQSAVEWWSASLELYVKYGISLPVLEDDFLDKASIRPGVPELFAYCAEHNIPTIILSAGIRDVIEIWCRRYNIQPSLIISTALTLDRAGKITGWEKDTLVHVLNKSEATHAELLKIRAERPKTFLVGDSMDDANMAAGNRDVVRIRVLDPRADEAAHKQEVTRTFTKFDALIDAGSLEPLREMIEGVA